MKEKAFDYTRMEAKPPRVPEPWAIAKGSKTPFVLLREGKIAKHCLSQSENGAHREGMVFIKEMDF